MKGSKGQCGFRHSSSYVARLLDGYPTLHRNPDAYCPI